MPRRVGRAEAIDSVVRVALARPGQTLFIGVDGRGGSGKSTLAEAIAAAVPDAVVVHVARDRPDETADLIVFGADE